MIKIVLLFKSIIMLAVTYLFKLTPRHNVTKRMDFELEKLLRNDESWAKAQKLFTLYSFQIYKKVILIALPWTILDIYLIINLSHLEYWLIISIIVETIVVSILLYWLVFKVNRNINLIPVSLVQRHGGIEYILDAIFRFKLPLIYEPLYRCFDRFVPICVIMFARTFFKCIWNSFSSK